MKGKRRFAFKAKRRFREGLRGLIEPAEAEHVNQISRISRQIRSHIRNSFSPFNQGLWGGGGGGVFDEKSKVRQSRDTVTLRSLDQYRDF
jgi:hypothetical protein